MKKAILFSVFSLFLTMLISTNGYAASYNYGFEKISDNGGDELNEGQLYASIGEETIDNNLGVSFTFYNVVGVPSSITEVVFGDNAKILSGDTSTTIAYNASSNGVEFTDKTTINGNPNDYNFVRVLESDSSKGINDGVNAEGEWIKFFGIYSDNFTFESLTASILSGHFNIGLHVQGINDDQSERYVLVDNNGPIPGGFGTPEVPLPAALWLFGPALLGFMGFRRKAKS